MSSETNQEADEAVVVNVQTGIYHWPGRYCEPRISDFNYRRLRSWKVAFKLGYTACGFCRPHNPVYDRVAGGIYKFHEINSPCVARWGHKPRWILRGSEALEKRLVPCRTCLWYYPEPRTRLEDVVDAPDSDGEVAVNGTTAALDGPDNLDDSDSVEGKATEAKDCAEISTSSLAPTVYQAIGQWQMLLKAGLLPFITAELERVHGDNWEEYAEYMTVDGAPHWDTQALVKTIIANLKDVFGPRLSPTARALVFELREWRNRVHHEHEVSLRDCERMLDTASRLLKLIGSPKSVDLDRLRLKILSAFLAEQGEMTT